MPSSFDPDRVEATTPRRESGWATVAASLKEHGCHGAMMRLKLFWQLEIPLFEACREANAYLLINDADNMPLGAAGLIEADVDCVVTDRADAERFGAYLQEKNMTDPRLWVIVHRLDDSWELPALRGACMQEVHRSPGIAVLEQCTILSAAKAPHFHVKAGEAVLGLRSFGQCSCGSEVLGR